VYSGGAAASRFAARKETLQLNACALAIVATAALWVPAFLTQDVRVSFALIGLATLGQALTNGPVLAAIQTLVDDEMRAISFAISYLLSNLIGMGLGPLAVGILSDFYHGMVGEESIRYALLTLSPGFLGAAWFAWRAAQTVRSDLTRLDLQEEITPNAELASRRSFAERGSL
jgi:MFS family permease